MFQQKFVKACGMLTGVSPITTILRTSLNVHFTWHKIFFILNLHAQNAWKFLCREPDLTLLLGAVYIKVIDV